MLGRAPRTKETLPDFFENMDPDKWDTTVWYRVTRNLQEFCGLTGCQRDPWIRGVTDKGIKLMLALESHSDFPISEFPIMQGIVKLHGCCISLVKTSG